MINLGFSTNAFKRNTLEEAIDAIARAGYSGVELMADIPHAYPPSFDSAARLKIKAPDRITGAESQQYQRVYAVCDRRYVSSDLD